MDNFTKFSPDLPSLRRKCLDEPLITRYFIGMLCHQCYKDKPEHLIGKTTGVCYTCLYGEREKRYRKRHKAEISIYFKKWYEKHRGDRKRQKNFPARNKRIYRMYTSLTKRYSISSLSRIFRISPPRIYKIIKQEEAKQKKSKL